MTLSELMNWIATTDIKNPVIKFPSSFVPYLQCDNCNQKTTIMAPLFRLTNDEVKCYHCQVAGDRANLQLMHIGDSIDMLEPEVSSYQEKVFRLSLSKLGFPNLHTILVQDEDGESYFFELSKDEQRVFAGVVSNAKKMKV